MMHINMPPERLFLEKSKTNVFVDMIGLMSHQYEGIRFLYTHYKKGQPGVILNDPPRYGKRVQIAAFIEAMKAVIKTDSLIICPDDKQEMWSRRVREWTFGQPEIIAVGAPHLCSPPARSVSPYLTPAMEAQVEVSNIQVKTDQNSGTPQKRPKLIVSALSHLKLVKDRTWGIVVVDLDFIPKELLRSGLKSEFKIWVTGVDVVKNLQDLVLMYKWLFEKKFDIAQFTPANETPRAVLAASVKLSAFTENFVLRRKNVDIDNILNTNRSTEMLAKHKIKRSKPIYDDESEVYSKDVSNKIEDIKNLEIADNPVKITEVDNGGKDREMQSPNQKKRRIEEKEHVDMKMELEEVANDAEQDIPAMDCESLDYQLRYESDTQENDDPYRAPTIEKGIVDTEVILLNNVKAKDDINMDNACTSVKKELGGNVSDSKTDTTLTAFEQKIKEMEEQALKKFKGLDHFF